MVNSSAVDLTNCDKEPIHILGKIQSHGFLIAVDCNTLLISYISANTANYTLQQPENYLGIHISIFEKELTLTAPGAGLQLAQLCGIGNSQGFEAVNPFYLELDHAPFNLVISFSNDMYLLEFEQAEANAGFDVQKTIGYAISQILAGASLHSLMQNAADEIKKIIGYDRVMIYKFNEDGDGKVIAEKKGDELKSFLGLHFPASDIPRQARELYKINLTRIIADVDTETSPIITNAGMAAPLDLTHSILRAVSPIHIQYLKNMGVVSSFSILLLHDNELWGLITCHHHSPKLISYKKRDAGKLIGQILSSALAYRQGELDSEKFASYNEAEHTLIGYIDKEPDISKALTGNAITIKNITSAEGALLILDNTIYCTGVTPSEEQILEITAWLKENMSGRLYQTHRFPSVFPPAKGYSNIASGIMAFAISNEPGDLLIWFKPELIKNVTWAGDPQKPVELSGNGLMQLSPRNSFEAWPTAVYQTAEKWNRAEIAAATNLREQIINAIRRKANEIHKLNERLTVAYDELDTFSFTVSHDLRTPLTAVKSYTELLLATNESLDDNAKKVLTRINACADKMAFLIKEILNYSGTARGEISTTPIDMSALIATIQMDVMEALQPANLEFTTGETPPLLGDAVMISQVFSNLIGNAVKYSSRGKQPKVSIEGKLLENEIIYSITDNGIGIAAENQDQVFGLFKRMDNVQDFEGTGVGLAIVKRIIEKHNAKIWFESKLGVGTTFYVSFKNFKP